MTDDFDDRNSTCHEPGDSPESRVQAMVSHTGNHGRWAEGHNFVVEKLDLKGVPKLEDSNLDSGDGSFNWVVVEYCMLLIGPIPWLWVDYFMCADDFCHFFLGNPNVQNAICEWGILQ